MRTHRPALTLVEVLIVIAAITLLLVIVMPVFAGSVESRRMLSSQTNLRVLGAAHAVYQADWNGRQLTYVDDLIATYGFGAGDAFRNYEEENGFAHPPIVLGWGLLDEGGHDYRWLAYRTSNCANAMLALPINFDGSGCNPGLAYFGSFRLWNAAQFNQYVGGRFYDDAFYTLDDPVVYEAVDDGGCFDVSDEYCNFAIVSAGVGNIPAWQSYCLSPAAMFNPLVTAHDDPDDPLYNGWVHPWSLADGFRSPPAFQALYPHLKSLVLEHHWLRNNDDVRQCNPAFEPGTYGDPGCEPFYFNHAIESAPLTLFYDGHVGDVSVAAAMSDDERQREQTGHDNWGLWSQDTPWGDDGYLQEFGFDNARTSFHVLTTDGILGRDILEPGSLRPPRSKTPPASVLRRAPPRRGAGPSMPFTLVDPLGE